MLGSQYRPYVASSPILPYGPIGRPTKSVAARKIKKSSLIACDARILLFAAAINNGADDRGVRQRRPAGRGRRRVPEAVRSQVGGRADLLHRPDHGAGRGSQTAGRRLLPRAAVRVQKVRASDSVAAYRCAAVRAAGLGQSGAAPRAHQLLGGRGRAALSTLSAAASRRRRPAASGPAATASASAARPDDRAAAGADAAAADAVQGLAVGRQNVHVQPLRESVLRTLQLDQTHARAHGRQAVCL